MVRRARQPSGPWRYVFLTLAALAVALKVAIPPGFMVAASADRPFSLVPCNGEAPPMVEARHAAHMHGDPLEHAPAKNGHASPCIFAGHALGAAPPTLQTTEPAQFVSYQAPARAPSPTLAPGRGLCGPPIPPRGPPSLAI